MCLTDTIDFYQIFLHIKQIIRPSKSQPYTKTRKKYRYQIFSILIVTRVDSQMLISQLCIPSLCRVFSRKGTCNLSTTAWQKRISTDRLHAKDPNLRFFTGQVAQFATSRKIIFQVPPFCVLSPNLATLVACHGTHTVFFFIYSLRILWNWYSKTYIVLVVLNWIRWRLRWYKIF